MALPEMHSFLSLCLPQSICTAASVLSCQSNLPPCNPAASLLWSSTSGGVGVLWSALMKLFGNVTRPRFHSTGTAMRLSERASHVICTLVRDCQT